eukprot:CCRYP_014598-RA/>CCRYP_014598-RA protein AED:0.80 eAED:0.80 QI:0/0/0/0.5/1/1/2/0/62
MKEGVLNEIKDEMEKRGFASSEFNTHTVTSRIDAVGEMSLMKKMIAKRKMSQKGFTKRTSNY